MITVTLGDTEFQKTLTDLERKYIHEGQNWISKGARETKLKALHDINMTLDDLEMKSAEEQKAIWEEAREKWNRKQS